MIVYLSFALAGCTPMQTPLPPEPTTTPQPATLTPTSTTIWFPPTTTPTPFPTPVMTPTQDLRPPMGEIILSDDFSDPEVWALARSPQASAALGVNELTLALHQPGGYLYSLRDEPLLSDFYLEITASPNLCRDADEYGLLLRASPYLELYRFSLSCDGRARVVKYHQSTISPLQPWVMSGAIPPGAPSTSRLAVWAKGREMLFFANGEYLFTVSDRSFASGKLGVFISSAGEDDLTVSFSDLVVRQTGDG
jgi:hypothetical protein